MKTILIADDDPVMVKLLEYNFKHLKANILISYEGSNLYEMILQEMPDVLVLDLILPGKSGLEILTEIKANPKTNRIPVFIITAREKAGLHEELKNKGALKVFSKPFSPKEIIKDIEQLIFLPQTHY